MGAGLAPARAERRGSMQGQGGARARVMPHGEGAEEERGRQGERAKDDTGDSSPASEVDGGWRSRMTAADRAGHEHAGVCGCAAHRERRGAIG